jgi:hypothetical protein
MSSACATCTGFFRRSDPVCFRAGIVTNAWVGRKASQAMDDVT